MKSRFEVFEFRVEVEEMLDRTEKERRTKFANTNLSDKCDKGKVKIRDFSNRGMENRSDFFNWLDCDVLMYIFMFLDDPADLVRASSVSRTWRDFVVKNGLCKLLCMRKFAAMHKLKSVIEPSRCVKDIAEVGSSGSVEDDKNLGVEHRTLAFLAHSSNSFPLRECIGEAISASSTDNYPDESVRNTLEPLDMVTTRRPSYWSSKGQSDDAVPENLVYKLATGICLVTEINIKPFQAYFQWGSPIYSAKSVRFRLAHSISPMDDPVGELCDSCSEEKMVWTYTSPEFLMAQENRLQKFKLPEPVMCVNGMLMVELLGRTQKQAIDGLFYICICNVQVMGRPLSPAFGVDILEPSGGFNLKVLSYEPTFPEQPSPNEYLQGRLQGRIRDLEQILNLLRDQGVVVEDYDWHGEEEEEEEEE